MAEWVERWRDVIASKAELPGVWKRRDGGFHVRARVTDPRTGKQREINRALPDVTKAKDAFKWLQGESEKIRAGQTGAASALPQFHKFAATTFERKVLKGRIKSASGRAKWKTILATHLVPAFGDFYVDQIRTADITSWIDKLGAKIASGKLAPTTANTILAVLRQITNEAAKDFEIRDPMISVEDFDTRGYRVYTEEEPNALAPADVPRFLAKMRDMFPHCYAMTVLGLATGLRPSSMRPLRRKGAEADLRWDDAVLLVRRSHTDGDETMESTKQGTHERLHLPPELMNVLEWHRDEVLLSRKMRESDLLFPAHDGGFRSRWFLRKPFAAVTKAIDLPYTFTPRGLRRTFQDLARAAGVHDAVTRSISGHATAEMQLHYSTAQGHEQRDAMAKVISIATGLPVAPAKRRRSA